MSLGKFKVRASAQRLTSVLGVCMFVLAIVFWGTQLVTTNADSGGYYTCDSGDTLDGQTCTHTYAALSHTTYSCNSGDTLSGQTCTHIYSACAAYPGSTYQNSGTYAGYCMLKSSTQPTNGHCPSGLYYWNGACYSKHAPTCNNGDTRNGGSCTHTYAAKADTVYSCSGGDTLSGQTCTHTYPAVYHSGTGGGGGGGGSGGGGSSGGSGGTGSTPPPANQTPSIPSDFKATIQSGKIVQLNWSTVTVTGGDVSYELDRSTDNASWSILTTTGNTAFTDDTTDFSTTYYYRLKAIGPDGSASDYATTQATTGNFTATGHTLTSDDKNVTVNIPGDAFDQQVDCSFDTSAAANAPTLPVDKLLLTGPYGLLCVGADGSTIDTFAKALSVTIKVPNGPYANFEVRQTPGDNWHGVASKYDAGKHQLSFGLTAATFAAFGTKQKSPWGVVFTTLMWLALLAVLVFGFWWWRRRRQGATTVTAGLGAAALNEPTAQQEFEEAALKPNCTHMNMAHQVQPQTSGCAECMAEHKKWKALRICLTCGHVGCSDDSDEQHARKHFEATGHPLIYEYGNPEGDTIGWCYIDQTYI